jgi:hypothetical protein
LFFIEARLAWLRGELENAEDLRGMIVGQSGQHVSGAYVRSYAEKIQALKEAVARAKKPWKKGAVTGL